MKFSHAVKFPAGERYEMREFFVEVDDAEFPELVGRTLLERTAYIQGTLLQMGLAFQVASGYLAPDSDDFRERLRLALELKKLPSPSTKVKVERPVGPPLQTIRR